MLEEEIPQSNVPKGGTQKPQSSSDIDVRHQEPPPFAPKYVNDALETLALSGKGFNSQAAQIVTAVMNQFAQAAARMEQELELLRSELKTTNSALNEAQKQVSVLETQLAALKQLRNIGAACSALGTLIFGYAISQFLDGKASVGFGALTIALLLGLVSWYPGVPKPPHKK